MPLKATGAKKAIRTIGKITPAVEAQFEGANRDNAHAIVDVAKVLVPVKSGATRAAIKNVPAPDGGQIIDFGPLSKILEGGTENRTTSLGANRGKGPARPFVNPAMQGTKKKRTARNRKAVRDALRIAQNG